MPKFIEPQVVIGKLGNHPGGLGPEQAVALFNTAMKCGTGATLLDFWPDGGRTTVILAAVAQNLEGTVTAEYNWATVPQGGEFWFERAVKGHKIKLAELNGKPPDLTVMRGEVVPMAPAEVLRTGKVFLYGQEPWPVGVGQAGLWMVEHGPGWAVCECKT